MKILFGIGWVSMALMALGADWTGSQSFSEDATIEESVALSGDVTVDVAAGKTVTISGVISGEGASIRKTGLGTLHLTAANTFTGGCTIESGYLRASGDDAALGTGPVTILGQREGYSGRCQLDLVGINTGADKYTPVRTFANDITITGDSTPALPAVVFYYQNVTVAGDVTAAKRFVFYDDFTTTKAVSSGQYDRYQHVVCADFAGAVTAAEGIFTAGWTTVLFHGKLTAPILNMCVLRPLSATGGEHANGNGNAHMAVSVFSSSNAVSEVVDERGYLYLAAPDAFTNTLFRFQCTYIPKLAPNSCSTIYNRNYDYGTKKWSAPVAQTFGGFEGDALHNGDAWSGGKILGNETHSVAFGSSYPVLITGVAPVDGETTRRCTSSVELYSSQSPLIVDAYVGFTQVFSNRIHTIPSAEIRTGAVEFAGKAVLKNLATLTVGEQGAFTIDSTTNNAMTALRTLSVAGSFEAIGNGCSNFTPHVIALALGTTAAFKLPAEEQLSVKTLTVGGVAKPAGVYTSTSLSQLKSGCLVVLEGPQVGFEEATFTGSGSLSDSTKWGSAVTLDNYSVRAHMGPAGAQATVDTAVSLGGVAFDAPGAEGEGGYKLAGDADGAGSLAISSGGLTIDESESPQSYVFTVPTTFYGNQEWVVPGAQRLVFDNALQDIVGTVSVKSPFISGAFSKDPLRGCIAFRGTNYFSGALVVTSTVVEVSGLLAAPGRVDQGTPSSRGAQTLSVLGNAVVGGKNQGGHAYLSLSNAVIEKPIYLTYQNGDSVIRTMAGTTNRIAGKMAWNTPWLGFRTAANSELIFANGLTIGWSTRSFGQSSGKIRIVEKPIDANVGCGWNVDGGTLSLEVAESLFRYLTAGYYDGVKGVGIDFKVSYATSTSATNALGCGVMWDNPYDGFRMKTEGNDTIRFNATTQRFSRVIGSRYGTLTGETGSRLEIYDQRPYGSFHEAENYLSSNISGELSLLMAGGNLLLTNQTFTTTGELEVTNGTVEIAADAVFTNLSAVCVSGAGQLKLDAARRINSEATLRLGASADAWCIDLTGVQPFAHVYTATGQLLKPGLYGGADCTQEGANKDLLATHLTGTGALRVRRLSTTLILR